MKSPTKNRLSLMRDSLFAVNPRKCFKDNDLRAFHSGQIWYRICRGREVEDKDDVTDDAIYERLEHTYERCPTIMQELRLAISMPGCQKFSVHSSEI